MAGLSRREIIEALIRARVLRPPWEAILHPKQFEAYRAKGDRAIVAGRRGGKSLLAACGLIDIAWRDGLRCPYLASTGSDAHDILWPTLARLNDAFGLGAVMDRQRLSMRFRNGGEILLRGADQENFVEKLRGKAWGRVCVDEPGSFHPGLLQYLLEEVIDPALADYDGDMWLTGTPNASCTGYFHDVATGTNPDVAAWQTYHWTLADNPFFAGKAEATFAKTLRKHHWQPNEPKFLREWMGLWVRDEGSLMFRFSRELNTCACMPDDDPVLGYVLAVDLGASALKSTTAFAVLAFTASRVYVVRAWRAADQTPSSIGETLTALSARYHPIAIVVDQGGLGGGYINEFDRRFGLPAVAADKANKLGFIELMNGDLRAGTLRFLPDANEAAQEIEFLAWNGKRTGPVETLSDHLADAVLYGWRYCLHYAQRAPLPEAERDVDKEALAASARRYGRGRR